MTGVCHVRAHTDEWGRQMINPTSQNIFLFMRLTVSQFFTHAKFRLIWLVFCSTLSHP